MVLVPAARRVVGRGALIPRSGAEGSSGRPLKTHSLFPTHLGPCVFTVGLMPPCPRVLGTPVLLWGRPHSVGSCGLTEHSQPLGPVVSAQGAVGCTQKDCRYSPRAQGQERDKLRGPGLAELVETRPPPPEDVGVGAVCPASPCGHVGCECPSRWRHLKRKSL